MAWFVGWMGSRSTGSVLAGTVVAAIVMGCGGGGGGASLSSSGTPSVGTATTGGTSSSGSSTTSGSSSPNLGKTTSGSTTSGSSTSGSSTSGSSTSGSTTTGSAPVNIPNGNLPNNTIYFSDGVYSGLTLMYMSPSGTGVTSIETLPPGIGAAVLNPNVKNGLIFAYSANGTTYSIYQNSSLSMAGAMQLVSTQFVSISMIQVTPDNKTLVFIGSQNGTSGLYTAPAAGGAATYLGQADAAALSPDGRTIVFSQATSAGEAILTIPTSGGGTTALTNGAFFDTDPQFSKDGSMIVFSSDRSASGSGGSIGIALMNLSTRALTFVTSDPNGAEFGPSFNASGTQIAYVDVNGNMGASGIFVCNADGSSNQQIYASDQIGQSCYWTGANGRGFGSSSPLFQRLKRR